MNSPLIKKNLLFRPLAESDLPDIRSWFGQSDGPFFIDMPSRVWWQYISSRGDSYSYCSLGPISKRVTVYSQFDVEEEPDEIGHPQQVAWLAIMTAPNLHGCGWGTKHWQQLEKLLKAMNIPVAKASILKENKKSKRFFKRQGFKRSARESVDPQLVHIEKALTPAK